MEKSTMAIILMGKKKVRDVIYGLINKNMLDNGKKDYKMEKEFFL